MQINNRTDRLRLGLAGVVARLLDAVQVGLVDIAGDVFAVENRAIEVVDLDLLAAADRFDQVRQVLVDQPVSTCLLYTSRCV